MDGKHIYAISDYDNSEAEKMKSVEERIKELPPELRQRVEEFVTSLVKMRTGRSQRKPSLSWRGALKNLRNRYTSVDLQHKILQWRIGGE